MIDENVEKLKNEQPKDDEPANDGDIEYTPEAIGEINVDHLIKKMGRVGKQPIFYPFTVCLRLNESQFIAKRYIEVPTLYHFHSVMK